MRPKGLGTYLLDMQQQGDPAVFAAAVWKLATEKRR
jgi:hypothetical protein